MLLAIDHRSHLLQVEFWSNIRIVSNGCWLWTGHKDDGGYGVFFVKGQHVGAHRIAWFLLYGEIPVGKCVCHDCPTGDNPLCCNPAHLWLGTNRQNQLDKVAKSRQARGATHGSVTKPEAYFGVKRSAKLTKEQVLDIRNTYLPYYRPARYYAEKYGVSVPTVHKVIYMKTWKEG